MLSADWRWIAFAVFCQASALTLIAINYRRILGRLGHTMSWQFMARTHLRRHVVATVVPFGSPASYVLFARDLAPKGVTGNDALSAMMLYSAGGQAAFVVFMTGTVSWLALTSNLPFSFIAVAIGVPAAIIWISLLFLALRTGANKLPGMKYVPARVRKLAERLGEHDLKPKDLLFPMLCSIGVNLTSFGMLLAALHAVGQQPSITSLLLVRIVAQVSANAMPVMHGAGVVEMSMVSAMQQMGVMASPAAAAAILFRCAQFWLPLALGVVLFVNLPRIWSWLSSVDWQLAQMVRAIGSRFGYNGSSGSS
jgi:uncharacterized membrane protein YbhN (UPF0104 family)